MIFQKGSVFTESFKISDEIYLDFSRVFKDFNPLHMNSEFAMKKGFKEKVMHGNILNGFLSYFIGECLPIKDVIIHSQSINYKNPVYLNEEVVLISTINDFYESVKTVEFKFRFTNKNNSITFARGNFQIGLI